jgi:hypothetical protein
VMAGGELLRVRTLRVFVKTARARAQEGGVALTLYAGSPGIGNGGMMMMRLVNISDDGGGLPIRNVAMIVESFLPSCLWKDVDLTWPGMQLGYHISASAPAPCCTSRCVRTNDAWPP